MNRNYFFFFPFIFNQNYFTQVLAVAWHKSDSPLLPDLKQEWPNLTMAIAYIAVPGNEGVKDPRGSTEAGRYLYFNAVMTYILVSLHHSSLP